ncbi:putative protein OS=Streptomyces antimycoticus OX=68175 GN=SANT12839_037260 PE=4 SV=1 [Streptomyces antimycoticus]
MAAGAVSPPRWARSRSAWPRTAAGDLADSTHGTVGSSTAGATAGVSFGSGACSSRVCALVPLMPNAETAARRGRPVSGHSRASVSSSSSPADQSTCGVGSSTCRVGGSTPCRSASTIFITPATPAAACVCPMLDLMEPSSRGRSGSRSWP